MKKNTRPTPQETDEEIDRIVAEFNDEMKRRGTYLDDADEDSDEMTVVIGGLPKPKKPSPKGG